MGQSRRELADFTIPQSASQTAPFTQGSLFLEASLRAGGTVREILRLRLRMTWGRLPAFGEKSARLAGFTIPQSAPQTAPVRGPRQIRKAAFLGRFLGEGF